MRRRLLPATASAALLLTGCVSIVSDSGTQTGTIGPVRLTAHVCVGDTTAADCSGQLPGSQSGQALLALRAPAGLTLPDSLPVDTFTLKANPSYTQALTAAYPPAGGQAWYGYATETSVTGSNGDAHDVVVDVPLPARPPGTPYSGPLKARLFVGGRNSLATGDFDCSATTTTHCIESPASTSADKAYDTRDLAVAPGDAATTEAGKTATVSFPVAYRGAAGPSFTQAATTTVPGATATPRNGSIAPATDQDRTEAVDVAVPAATTPGDYTVTLTEATGGETRSGTATLKVTPAAKPVTTPTPTPTAKPTVTAAPTAQPTPFAKVAPASFTAGAKPKRDSKKPYRFTVTGKVGLPTGVGQDGVTCAGKVKVTARRFGISVGSKATTVQTSCRYALTVTVKKPGRIRLETRFGGNAVLTPKSAKALRVRTG